MEGEDIGIAKQSESIKLVKNSKGYNWEIRLLELDLKKLDELNNQLIEKYGNQTE